MLKLRLLPAFFAFIFILISCNPDNLIYSDHTIIIIKADDLGNMTNNWQNFISKSVENDVPVSIGVIASHMTDDSTKIKVRNLSKLRSKTGNLLLEFWNHGYDHSRDNNVEEFRIPNLAYQIDHIKRSQVFFKDSLGIESTTFSTPFNESSDTTFEALKHFPEIKIWMCYQRKEKQFHTSWIDPDFNVLKPTENQILLNVRIQAVFHLPLIMLKRIVDSNTHPPYLIIQIHPNTWEDHDFEDYQTMIDYLKQKKFIFMTPQQYYLYLKHA